MEAILAAGPVNGRWLRKTVLENETVEQESKKQKGEAGNRNLKPTGGRNYPSSAEPHNRTNSQVKKS